MDLSSIDPELDRLVNGPKRKRVSYPDQEQEQGIVGNLRDNSLTMLGAIGNTLDLQGSMVPDAFAWKNPVDQLLSPFSDKNRTTGRDLARKWGIAKKRDTYGNFWGGLGIEAALDPLTYATLGGSALSKAGIAAKNAGLMDDLARVSARKLGKPIGMVGPREGRIATTLADFVAEGGDVGARARKAIDAGANADEALGGVMGIGLPFSDPMMVFGNGARGQTIARGMDTGARLLRFAKIPGTEIKPVNAFLNLFDAPAKGMDTPIGQAIARENFRKQQKAEFMPRLETARWATEMENAGLTDQASMDKLRGYIELSHDPFSKFQRKDVGDTIANIGDQIRAQVDSAVQQQKAVGIRASELTDQYVNFLSRQMTQSNSFKPKTGDLALDAMTQASKKRNDFLRNVPGGTERLKNELFMDPELNRLVDEGKTRKQIAQYIKKKHGSWFNDSDYMVYRPKDKNANVDGYVPSKGRVQKTATWFSKLSKELRDTGVFGNTPLADHEGYMLSKARGEENARSVAQALAQPNVLMPESLKGNAAADGSKTVSEILRAANLTMETFDKKGNRAGGFMDILRAEAAKNGKTLPNNAKALNRMRVSGDIAQDVTNIMKSLSGPKEVNKLIQVADSIVNAFKAHVTGPWPNFQVRNLMSGMTHNFMFGMWDSQSTKDAAKMIQGGVIKDASKEPFIMAEAARRGITQLDDVAATRILGEIASATGLVGKFEGLGGNVVGAAPGPSTSGNIQDILSGIMRPGVKSLDWKRVGRKYIGREPGTSIKPKDWFATRGVGGATESKFGPAAGGEEIGHSVESLIRLSGWLNQIRKGVDPIEAAKRVGDAQVLYGNKNYTNFETQWMTRMVPFFKFSRKMIPQIVQDLAQRPGGRYGQMIRMMRASQDQGELAPDYVRDSLSIPFANNPVLESVMGKAPEGTDRYITGFGLPHEDLLSFSPTARGSMLELLSRTNPLIKAPLEFATGETFFQRGPEGGRELSKLDPTVGRLISNLGRMTGLRESTDPVRLPQVVEQAITNSPLTKAVTTARMLTDERKQSNYGILPFTVPGVPALSNVLTGVRVNDVSPQAKQAMVDELLQNQMKERGASEFSRTRFSKKDLEKMDPVDRQIAEQLNSYANLLAKRTKERVKQKEKE